EVEDLRADLRCWLQHTASTQHTWKPIRAELGFGMPLDPASRDPRSSEQPVTVVNGAQISGSIDLVEQNVATHALRVTDHKTGKPPERMPRTVGGGQVLQPLLYALAAEQLLGGTVAA